MSEEVNDDQLDQFLQRVEEETGKEPLPDPYIGDICWFMIHHRIKFQGETFTAEFDMNLSEEDVTPQWGEILIDIPDEERETILDDETDRIEYRKGDEALYEFPASEEQIPELMEDLRMVHAEFYG